MSHRWPDTVARVHRDTVDPTVNDDSTKTFNNGYRFAPGDIWINTTSVAKGFVLLDGTPTAAVWKQF